MEEFEYKRLLSRKQFRSLVNLAQIDFISEIQRLLQVNYYYDTPTMEFDCQATTIRIRQIGDKVGNLLNQIARLIYYSRQIDYESLEEALKQYADLSKKILTDTEHDKVDIYEIIHIAKERAEKTYHSAKP